MEALMADLGAIRTRRATQNVAAGGSAMVAEKAYEREYLTALRADILNQRYGIVARRAEADQLRQGARASMLSGYANAISTLGSGFMAFGGGAPGGGAGTSGYAGAGVASAGRVRTNGLRGPI